MFTVMPSNSLHELVLAVFMFGNFSAHDCAFSGAQLCAHDCALFFGR